MGFDVWKKTIEKSETSRTERAPEERQFAQWAEQFIGALQTEGWDGYRFRKEMEEDRLSIDRGDTLKPEQFTGRVWAFVRERIQPNFPNRDLAALAARFDPVVREQIDKLR
mgnify:CR=1 FL=1